MSSKDGLDQYDRELDRTTTIVLAEFAGLRGEIATRINLQATLILGNLTVLGVILGIALSHPGNKNVPTSANILLLLPLVTPFIGMHAVDGYRSLDILGKYIHRVIRPQLQIESHIEVESAEVFGWERWIDAHRFTMLWLEAPLQLVVWLGFFLEFLGAPIAVLIVAVQYHLHHPHMQVSTLQVLVWWMGAILTGLLILYMLGSLLYSVRIPQLLKRQVRVAEAGDAGENRSPASAS